MPNLFLLDIETQADNYHAVLRLFDNNNVLLATNEVTVTDADAFYWQGLFDTRRHVENYANNRRVDWQSEPLSAEQLLAEIGEFLGQKVLGSAILQHVYDGIHQRTVLIRLPDTQSDVLAAAFARVPWDVACPNQQDEPLYQKGVVVRAITKDDSLHTKQVALSLANREPLRVLLVFAQADTSALLNFRLEREHLLTFFYDKILPKQLVQVDVLAYAVSREAIKAQVKQAKGYHIVHWSGHGRQDGLELYGGKNKSDLISSAELIELFKQAGGFIPQLVFLSACHSGGLISAKDWDSFKQQALKETTPQSPPSEGGDEESLPPVNESLLQEQGYTGVALALLQVGVQQVVGMRYSVTDRYAQQVGRLFYERLLADGFACDAALASARSDLARMEAVTASVVDHVTPMLFGQDVLEITAFKGRSEQADKCFPQPWQMLLERGYQFERPVAFVGRHQELTRLQQEWLDESGQRVAIVQGLAGLGKTTIAAEAIHLWHTHFKWVLVVQAKGDALPAEEFYRKIDFLLLESEVYQEQCRTSEFKAIVVNSPKLQGEMRYNKMRNNLIEMLHKEKTLLVIDNFETCLLDSRACKDPEWSQLLQAFVQRLQGAGSRVLLTSRHLPVNLEQQTVLLQLGALAFREARMLFESHAVLRALHWADRRLAMRVWEVSRGHPLIMQRLADMAGDKTVLEEALNQLAAQGLSQLPDLLVGVKSEAEQAKERQYLDDVAVGSVDFLIGRLTEDARQLLWVLTRALEPVSEFLLKDIWEFQGLTRDMKAVATYADNPEALAQIRKDNPDKEERTIAALEQLKNYTPPAKFEPLLHTLVRSGLVQKMGDEHVEYYFHELVRERCSVWMQNQIDAQAEQVILTAYGERYGNIFKQLRQANRTGDATEFGIRGIIYLVKAQAFGQLSDFASKVINRTKNPQQLQPIIQALQTVIHQVPAGRARWAMQVNLADGLDNAGLHEQALPFYEQAYQAAQQAQNWDDMGWISQNWAVALLLSGKLQQAREVFLQAAEAERQAQKPEIHILGSQLEAWRIDVMQGNTQVLGEIEQAVATIKSWWQQTLQGQTVAQAPDPEFLARAFISALDIARMAYQGTENWQGCLDILSETEQLQRQIGRSEHEIARTQFNRYGALLKLGQLSEAQQILEQCLHIAKKYDDLTQQSRILLALATIWNERGDTAHAIELERQSLAICERLHDPNDRAISHGNLANYLRRAEQYEASAQHRLAAIIYFMLIGNKPELERQVNNLAIDKKQNPDYTLPRIDTLLALPEFASVKAFVEQWGVDVGELQGVVDGLID